MPACLNEQQNAIITKAKQLISRYEDMAELIRLGAYRKGSDPEVDEAIALYPRFEEFLKQHKEESTTIDEAFAMLGAILGMPYGDQPVQPQTGMRRMPQRGEVRRG